MTHIFISYRRADSGVVAQNLYDALTLQFRVFMDVEDIDIGKDFRAVIEREIIEADIVLIVIGPDWINIVDEAGIRRLDKPNDLVRIEAEMALRHKKTVIPITVNGAAMPSSDELPASLHDLPFLNGEKISGEQTQADIDRLISRIRQKLGLEAKSSPRIRTRLHSIPNTIENVKRLMANPQNSIELEDLVLGESENTYQKLTGSDFNDVLKSRFPNGTQNTQDIEQRAVLYFETTELMLNIVSTICWYGNGSFNDLITKIINRWFDLSNQSLNDEESYFPVMYAIYAGGIAASSKANWQYLQSCLFDVVVPQRQYDNNGGMSYFLGEEVLLPIIRSLSSFDRRAVFVGELLQKILRPVFQKLHPADREYHRHFDLFEMLFSLSYLTGCLSANPNTKLDDISWMPINLTCYQDRSWDFLKTFWQRGGKQGKEWQLLKTGQFADYDSMFDLVLARYVNLSIGLRKSTVFHANEFPAYHDIYRNARPYTLF